MTMALSHQAGCIATSLDLLEDGKVRINWAQQMGIHHNLCFAQTPKKPNIWNVQINSKSVPNRLQMHKPVIFLYKCGKKLI
jgi:hypothetical protein